MEQTFPRLQESVNIPITHALFTEHSDCTDAMLKTPNVGITELLSKPGSAGVLKYLLVSFPIPLLFIKIRVWLVCR